VTTPVIETPTGVLLGTFKPGEPGWDAARAGLCITATEIAAVLGLSPWMSAYTLWHKKAGLPTPPFIPNPYTEWGVRLEPVVAQKFTEMHPEYEVVETGTWQHHTRPAQRATPDRLFAIDGQIVGVAEVKTSPQDADEWGPAGSSTIPIYYQCQATWQMDTLGLRQAILPVLIGGWDYREYVLDYDADDAALLWSRAEAFLATVAHGIRPDPDGTDSTYATAKLQHPGRDDDTEVDIGPHLAERYREALASATALKTERKRLAVQVLERMGGAKYATSLGERIAIRTVDADGQFHSLMPATGRSAA
jgi:putative phage-type endonuclease